MKNKLFLSFCFLLLLMISSCGSSKSSQLRVNLEDSNCNRNVLSEYSEDELPKPIHEIKLSEELSENFTFKSLNVAHAIGILEMLEKFLVVKQQHNKEKNVENRLAFLEIKQDLNQRINISSLEISAVISEIDCEEERTDQIANYLKMKEDKAETNLTVAAIIVGATGAVIAGSMLASGNTGTAPELVGIGTGLTEATLGLLILLKKRKVDFRHKRNPLQHVWDARRTSDIFPASVWYYLTYFDPNKPEEPSLRYQVVEQWMNYGQIFDTESNKKRKLIDIYFNEGGKYTSEQLFNRANMLDQVEAAISLMKQDLKTLAKEIENSK